MAKQQWILIIAVSLGVCACKSEKTIDGKSEEAFKKSIEEVKNGLPTDQREDFDKAIMATALDGANLFEAAADAEGMKNKMRDRLDGKTAKDILAKAEDIRTERRNQQNEQIQKEIEELTKREADAKESSAKLKAFSIDKSRFYFDDSKYSTKPLIELSVTNNTKFAISRAYFRGVLATPGRSVPWVEDDFNYSISGGLEAGETAVWTLAPNMFGEWGKAPKDRQDMVFTATVKRIDGADGEALLDANFSDDDRKRLIHLRSTLKHR